MDHAEPADAEADHPAEIDHAEASATDPVAEDTVAGERWEPL